MAVGKRLNGQVEASFWPVARSLERQLRWGGGAAVCVYYGGRKVVDLWGGARDDAGSPWQDDTMAMSFSTSKGVISTLIHVLADRGALDYRDPIARHWPAFGANGKARITVHDLLTHRARLPRIRTLVDRAERLLDWEYMVRALERTAPQLPADGRSAYHALTYGWLGGELIQRVTGAPLQRVIHDELTEPLALDGLYIGATADAKQRAAQLCRRPGQRAPRALVDALLSDRLLHAASWLYRRIGLPLDPGLMLDALVPPGESDLLWDSSILDVPVPAVNGLFTARSLAKMYAALAGAGEVDGVRLLSSRTAERASRIEVSGTDRVIPLPMQWRLGYHAAFTVRGAIAGAFGHFGFGGSGAWADPARGLAVAMVTNRLGGSPFGDGRIAEINRAVLASLRPGNGESCGPRERMLPRPRTASRARR